MLQPWVLAMADADTPMPLAWLRLNTHQCRFCKTVIKHTEVGGSAFSVDSLCLLVDRDFNSQTLYACVSAAMCLQIHRSMYGIVGFEDAQTGWPERMQQVRIWRLTSNNITL